MKTDQNELRETAAAQSEVRRAAVDENADNQPEATYAENPPEDPIDREDVEVDVPDPKVFSSADMSSSKVPTATQQKLAANLAPQHREPTATERKLAEQGVIPPYRS